MIQVKNKDTKSVYEINEEATLQDMENNCPRFFKNKHEKRETYTTHRGCLIVRNTVNYSSGPIRETAVYVYCKLENKPDLFRISAGSPVNSIDQAKRLINHMLKTEIYHYGFHYKK